MSARNAKADQEGRLISHLLEEDVPLNREDFHLTPSLADVAGHAKVTAHLAKQGAKPLASIASRVKASGEVEELRWVINGPGASRMKWRMKASILFRGAPGRGAYVGVDCRWDEFSFLPGEFMTGWRSAEELNICFYKGKNSEEKFSAAEVNEWGVFDFQIRLGLSLCEDIDKATVLVLAMPVSSAGLSALPGYVEPGLSYPHVCIQAIDVDLGPMVERKSGQALQVFVHHVQAVEPEWTMKEVWEGLRDMMANPKHTETPNTLVGWHSATQGPGAPETVGRDLRQTYSWPPIPEEQLDDDGTFCHV